MHIFVISHAEFKTRTKPQWDLYNIPFFMYQQNTKILPSPEQNFVVKLYVTNCPSIIVLNIF